MVDFPDPDSPESSTVMPPLAGSGAVSISSSGPEEYADASSARLLVRLGGAVGDLDRGCGGLGPGARPGGEPGVVQPYAGGREQDDGVWWEIGCRGDAGHRDDDGSGGADRVGVLPAQRAETGDGVAGPAGDRRAFLVDVDVAVRAGELIERPQAEQDLVEPGAQRDIHHELRHEARDYRPALDRGCGCADDPNAGASICESQGNRAI